MHQPVKHGMMMATVRVPDREIHPRDCWGLRCCAHNHHCSSRSQLSLDPTLNHQEDQARPAVQTKGLALHTAVLTAGRVRFCCPPAAAPGRFSPASGFALPATTS